MKTKSLHSTPVAVLFDLDGTLVDTKRLYLECYRRAVEPRLARRPSDEELLALRPRSEIRFLASLVAPTEVAGCRADFYEYYDALHPSHFDGVYEGVATLLEGLRSAGHRVGIVTGKSRRAWEITGPVAQLGPFDVIVLDDDVDDAKPDPHGIRIALERLDTPAACAVYIGDTMSDVLAARAAGVTPVAATWGRRSDREGFAARALEAGAVLAHRPADVFDAVRPFGAHRLRA
ncbi:MAG TPA: HAD-IA family hydrolase [Longimicrobiales bacterium]|nr:HAD-IA family hydrolase [Longimicrobiales bacterium]